MDWSPNSDTLAIVIRKIDESDIHRADVYLWNVRLKKLRKLTECSHAYDAIWTPDGTKIANAGQRDQGGQWVLEMFDGVSGQPIPLPTDSHWQNNWSIQRSPNGKLMASGSLERAIKLWNPSPKTSEAFWGFVR